MKYVLQQESMFYSDLLSEGVTKYGDTFRLRNLIKDHPKAKSISKVIDDAELIISKHELSEIDRQKGWDTVLRAIQIIEDIFFIATPYTVIKRVDGAIKGAEVANAITTALGGTATPIAPVVIGSIIGSIIGVLINRLIRNWSNNTRVRHERSYALQALHQLKRLEKKLKGKDKEEVRKQIEKLENALKQI